MFCDLQTFVEMDIFEDNIFICWTSACINYSHI